MYLISRIKECTKNSNMVNHITKDLERYCTPLFCDDTIAVEVNRNLNFVMLTDKYYWNLSNLINRKIYKKENNLFEIIHIENNNKNIIEPTKEILDEIIHSNIYMGDFYENKIMLKELEKTKKTYLESYPESIIEFLNESNKNILSYLTSTQEIKIVIYENILLSIIIINGQKFNLLTFLYTVRHYGIERRIMK